LKKFFTLLITLLLFLSFLPTPVMAGTFSILEAFWGTPSNPIDAGPGDTNVPITLSVQYYEVVNTQSLHATLFLSDGFTDSKGNTWTKAYITNIAPNNIFTLTFYLNIPPKARLGIYNFPIEFTWNSTRGLNQKQSSYLTLELKGKAKLTFESLIKELIPGKVNELKISVRNDGSGDARDLSINIIAPSQLSLLDKPSDIPLIKAGESIIFTIKTFVTSSLAGIPLTLSITANYKDPYLNPRSISQNLGLYVKQEEMVNFEINTTRDTLKVGEILEVPIKISNIGNSNILSASVTLTPQPPLILMNSDGKFILGDLPLASSKEIKVKFYLPPTSSSTVSLQILFSYQDQLGNFKNEQRLLYFLVDPSVKEAKFAIDANPRELEAGKVNKVNLKIKNIGEGFAYDILPSISISGQATLLNNLEEIPILSPGESRNLTLSLFVADQPSRYPLSISFTITFKDNFQNTKSFNQVIGFYTKSLEASKITLIINPFSLNVGSINLVNLTLTNNGPSILYSLAVTLSTQPPLSLIESDGHIVLGDLLPNKSKSFQLKIYVAPTEVFSTSLLASISYLDEAGTLKTDTRNLSLLIAQDPKVSPINLSLNSSNLIAGKVGYITISLFNSGEEDIKAVTISASLGSSQLSWLEPDIIQIPLIKPKESVVFKGKIYASPQSPLTSTLQLSIRYYDFSNTLHQEIRSIGLLVFQSPQPSPISLSIEPSILQAGRINNVTINVKNVGNSSLSMITLLPSFTSTQVTWLYPDKIQIPSLSAGSNSKISGRVYVQPQAPPSLNLELSISYYDSNNVLQQESRNIGLLSKGIIEVKVTDFTVVPERPNVGQIFSITLTLSNSGTITASSLTLTPQPPQEFRLLGSRSIFVGDLQAGVTTTLTISMSVNPTAKPGVYQIPLEISYLDNLRNVETTKVNLRVTIEELTTRTFQTGGQTGVTGFSWWNFSLLIIVGVVASLAGFFLGKRRKKI